MTINASTKVAAAYSRGGGRTRCVAHAARAAALG